MSQLLLDEIFDNEEEDAQGKLEKTTIGDNFQQPPPEMGSRKEEDLHGPSTSAQPFGEEKAYSSLQAAISTPSLSESNASTSLLCKVEKKGQLHLSIDAIKSSLKKQASDESSDAGGGNCAGYSCTVYYDALEEQQHQQHLLDKEKGGQQQQQLAVDAERTRGETGRFVLNPVFCEEEEEWTAAADQQQEESNSGAKHSSLGIEDHPLASGSGGEAESIEEREEEDEEEGEEEEEELPLGTAGLAASSRQSLISRRSPKAAAKASRSSGQQQEKGKKVGKCPANLILSSALYFQFQSLTHPP